MHFDLCFHYPADQLQRDQWDAVVAHFGPRNVYLLGEPQPIKSKPLRLANVTFVTADSIPGTQVLMTPKNARFVPGETSILDFEHPDDCTYYFGPDWEHLRLGGMNRPDFRVYIPLDDDTEMWSFMAAVLTLWDRRLRHG
jgi:hypothetical protein